MQTPANHIDVTNTNSQSRRIKAFIPIVLVVVVLAALFSISDNKQNPNPNPGLKSISVKDGPGADPAGTYSCRTAAWRDATQILINNGIADFVTTLEWWSFVLGGSVICTVRPDNPSLILDCRQPKITVAILVDRSSSVIRDGLITTPNDYKNQIKALIQEFNLKFVSAPMNGEINFLIYAFGTKAVLQNPTTDSARPIVSLGNVRISATSVSDRNAINNAVDAIHFRNEEGVGNPYLDKRQPNSDTPGFQKANNFPSQVQRAYNLDAESNPGEYGKTNWHDAFIKVIEDGTYLYSLDPGRPRSDGNYIDLAVMITDGEPSADDGSDWRWNAGSFHGTDTFSFDPAADGIDINSSSDVSSWNSSYGNTDDLHRITTGGTGRRTSSQAIDILRNGFNPSSFFSGQVTRSIAPRNQISVKGIVVNTSGDSTSESNSISYANHVFGAGNFFFANGFTTALESQVKSLVTDVLDESTCPGLNKPALSLSVNTNLVKPMEGSVVGESATFTVTNAGDGPLVDVTLCAAKLPLLVSPPTCNAIASWPSLGIGGVETYTHTYFAVLGQPNSAFTYWVEGTSTSSSFAPGFSGSPSTFNPVAPVNVANEPLRGPLPA